MKKYGLKVLTMAVLLCFSYVNLASAEIHDKKFEGTKGSNLISLVSNLGWIPDGKDTGKYMYVFFSPDCSYSAQLFDATRELVKTMQIRWIPSSLDGSMDSMFEDLTVEALEKAFDGELPADKNSAQAKAISTTTTNGIIYAMSGQLINDQNAILFPTIVYGDKKETFICMGLGSNVDAFIKELGAAIPQETPNPSFVPDAVRYANTKIELIPIKPINEYTNEGSETAILRLLPFKDSPRIGGLPAKASAPLPIIAVTKDGYLGISLTGTTVQAFLEDKAFAEKILEKNK